MITNEVPVTILQAYFSLPRHIRKGVLIRWIITSDLCTAIGCQQFRTESRKLQRTIMFESIVTHTLWKHCIPPILPWHQSSRLYCDQRGHDVVMVGFFLVCWCCCKCWLVALPSKPSSVTCSLWNVVISQSQLLQTRMWKRKLETEAVKAFKFLWKRKHFDERGWKRKRTR